MSDLGEDLARAYEARVAAADVELTPAAIRAVVRELGGGEGRHQVAAGNKELAGQLGISVRTVQRWQKEGGQGEARSVARSTPGLRISVRGIATAQQRAANARAFRERVQEQGLDVGACRVLVKVYNEERARPRSIGAQHIGGDALTAALDALEGGDAVGASESFGRAWLDAYGMDDVDATITDVVGTFGASL